MTSFPEMILVGVDGAEPSLAALRRAVDLASAAGASLHVAHVKLTGSPLRPAPMNPPHGEQLRDEGRQLLDRCAEIARERGVELDGTHLRAAARADRELTDLCAELGADVLAVGAGRSARTARRLVGSIDGSLLVVRT
jgi:nucleotide-binding universal stress UspA family protein